MQFNIYQQDKSNQNKEKKKAVKRVLKAEYKSIRYEAKTNSSEAVGKEQASDYYLTLFDSQKNQAYSIKIENALQFH